MADFIYPSSAELRMIEQQKLPRLMAQRPIFDIFKVRETDQADIMWEQMDNYTGLQQARGLNGAPPIVKKPGLKRYIEQPGVYGEFELIDETELTRRRKYGTLDQAIEIDDLVTQSQDHLLGRRLDRIETIGWTLLTAGTFSVPGLSGATLHTGSYTAQSFSAVVPWGTVATATPLSDFRSVKLLARGYSVRFDATAKAYANSTTWNRFYNNFNPQDVYGRRTEGFGTINSPAQASELLMKDNLPQIVEYDEGYIDESNTFNLFIPTGTVVVVGNRLSGTPIAEYLYTRNANNSGLAPGPYTRVIDRGVDTIPRSIEVHDGHSGGPTMAFPSAIVVMAV